MNIFTNKKNGNKCELLKILQLTIYAILICVTQVNALSYGQKINFKKDNISIKEMFKIIKSQTDFDVLWNEQFLNSNKIIRVNFNNATLVEVLESCIDVQQADFVIVDKTVIIRKRQRYQDLKVVKHEDSLIFKGVVLDENGNPLLGATIKLRESTFSTKTNAKGEFALRCGRKATIIISYVGYLDKALTLAGISSGSLINIKLVPGNNVLGEVSIVSTGYQDLPKERATGSFEVITKEQLQHNSETNLVKRLEGITTGMNFNNQLQATNSSDPSRPSAFANLTIRGKNTLNIASNEVTPSGQVLVVIDGIASPYSIDNINPNDVESITVLRDAASASIWGSRAANGVIVIKTKRGSYDKPLSVSFNTNFIVNKKIDLFYKNFMSTSEYIDAQIFQFNAAGTSIGPPSLSITQALPSPVAEILNQQKQGVISAVEAKSQIDALRNNDIRKDYSKYLLRNSFTQSYSFSLDGGNKKNAYRISVGYDKTLNNTINSDQNRTVINYSNSYKIFKNFEVNTNITYNRLINNEQPDQNAVIGIFTSNFYPYTKLADEVGNPLAVPKTYRQSFIDLLKNTYKDVLDLTYKPLEDINAGYYKNKLQTLNFSVGANYKINSIFSAIVLGNYNFGYNDNTVLYRENSFYMRNLINYYTSPSGFITNVPKGGLLLPSLTKSNNKTLRAQINADKTWGTKHALDAIAGVDIAENYFKTRRDQYYGYNETTLSTQTQLNYNTLVTTLFGDNNGINSSRIPFFGAGIFDQRIRTYSLFANGAYTYNKLYTASFSIRKDQSSEFGKGTNKGGTPFYSTGISWNIANEKFYSLSWLPQLQLKATFGYNGNVNGRVSAAPILSYSTDLTTAGLYGVSSLQYATNLLLRPEKSKVINLGLYFGLRDARLSGSFEYYDKKTTDLISTAPVDPSTGFSSLNFNTASLHTQGIDFTINSQNFQYGLFRWSTTLLMSYNRVKVAKLYANAAKTVAQVINGAPNYNEGYDLSRLFAYKWAGLDPTTGDPRGILNNQSVSIPATSQGTSVFNSIGAQPSSQAHYFGSSVPVYFGALRNTLSYGRLSLSANLLFKFGYYFRRPLSEAVSYSTLVNSNLPQGGEFSNRWQKPGDELRTNVPSFTYPVNSSRDVFYQYSEINVLKGDHIRLQEINVGYNLNIKKSFIKNPRIYANISNLGIVWKANKAGLDPDIFDYPRAKNYAFGISGNF